MRFKLSTVEIVKHKMTYFVEAESEKEAIEGFPNDEFDWERDAKIEKCDCIDFELRDVEVEQ